LWFGRGSVPSVARMVSELEAQKQKNAQAQLVNDQLAAELSDLREGQAMIEEKARLELGMVKPNEIFVQITKK
jgi:cell division protein FtsB